MISRRHSRVCQLNVSTRVEGTPQSGLGSITIVIVIDCNRLQLERNRNCNCNQIFQIVA